MGTGESEETMPEAHQPRKPRQTRIGSCHGRKLHKSIKASAIWARDTHARAKINLVSTDNKALQARSGEDSEIPNFACADIAGLGVATPGVEEFPKTASSHSQAPSHQETP